MHNAEQGRVVLRLGDVGVVVSPNKAGGSRDDLEVQGGARPIAVVENAIEGHDQSIATRLEAFMHEDVFEPPWKLLGVLDRHFEMFQQEVVGDGPVRLLRHELPEQLVQCNVAKRRWCR